MPDRRARPALPALALFLLLSVGGGLAIGAVTAPGEWYAALQKPPFNPPGWVFGPVWTILYVLIGVTGWRLWRSADVPAMRLWWAQMALNFLWSPVFFAAGRIGPALLVILALLAAVALLAARARQVDPPSARMTLPYLLWVAFATLLNAAILVLNPGA